MKSELLALALERIAPEIKMPEDYQPSALFYIANNEADSLG